jgi:folate-dependent phosphoribosylglycinamide formyltransferase PurN
VPQYWPRRNCMSIVVITLDDIAKRSVVARLQAETNGGVSLVIVQTAPSVSLQQRVARWWGLPVTERVTSLYYALLLRLSTPLQAALTYFRTRPNHPADTDIWTAPVLHTTDINSHEVIEAIRNNKPSLLVVWGSQLLSPELVARAPKSINLHMGISTHYRGATANQRAVLAGDYAHIGATIHYINGAVDAGDVLVEIRAVLETDPVQTFSSLNQAAEAALVVTAAKLFRGEVLPVVALGSNAGYNCLLRDWTPARRYQVAQRLLAWQRDGVPPQSDHS